jgi:microcystin-dependent protein
MDPILGTIVMFSGSFAPRGWAFCDGSLLSIGTNTALFSIIGNTYGGDGKTTFALPDLRGRVPLGVGEGPGLTPCSLGQAGTGGGGQGDKGQPFLGINFIIALEGVYPPRE